MLRGDGVAKRDARRVLSKQRHPVGPRGPTILRRRTRHVPEPRRQGSHLDFYRCPGDCLLAIPTVATQTSYSLMEESIRETWTTIRMATETGSWNDSPVFDSSVWATAGESPKVWRVSSDGMPIHLGDFFFSDEVGGAATSLDAMTTTFCVATADDLCLPSWKVRSKDKEFTFLEKVIGLQDIVIDEDCEVFRSLLAPGRQRRCRSGLVLVGYSRVVRKSPWRAACLRRMRAESALEFQTRHLYCTGKNSLRSSMMRSSWPG